MSNPTSRLPERPSLAQLRKQAKELLRSLRAGDAPAAARLAAIIPRFAAPSHRPATLADAQFVIAREYGFTSWADLAHRIPDATGGENATRPPLRPLALAPGNSVTLADGSTVESNTVWAVFLAAHAGDLRLLRSLVDRNPPLATHEYNYTPPIHFAVREGHVAATELLLERGADPAYRTYPFQDALLTMAEDREHAGVAAVVRRALARRFALGGGVDALLTAARNGDLATVDAELARDPSLAARSDATGDTALHQAASGGHLDVVRALLAAGAAVDVARSDGYRPLHCALRPRWEARVPRDRATTIADLLIARGARETIYTSTLRGDRDRVRAALAHDPSLANFEDTCHRRPISAAAERDDLDLVRLLLAHGADPNLPEEGAPRGHALWIAVYRRQREMAHALVAHGADPNAMVESSGTPMMHARKDPELDALLRAHGGHVPAAEESELERLIGERDLAGVERLIEAKLASATDPTAFWNQGVLAGPAHAGDIALLELLVRHGARVPRVSEWGRYYYFKHTHVAGFLLDHGMDPNHMSWHRTTLLHHTAADGDLAQMRLLLDHGADIDAIDDEYRSTPLGMAARWGRTDAATLLLERGADPNLAGAAWATPLAWARKKGHAGVERLLGEAGAG